MFRTAIKSTLFAATAIGLATSAPAQPALDSGIKRAAMDPSVKPGDDFYLYANGTWQKNAVIAADRNATGGFLVAAEATEKKNAALIAHIAKSTAPANTDEGRIRDYYNAYLDTAAIDAAGMAPIKPDLERFAQISTVGQLSRVLGEQVRADVDPFNSTNFQTSHLFGMFVTQSLAGHGVIPYLLQGGLGLPEREFYLSPDAKMATIRTQYQAYIAHLLTDAGLSEPQARAARIFALEMKIAAAHETREQSEDYQHDTDEWTQADFAAKAPGIAWTAFFTAAHLGAQPTFAAYHATAIPRLSALVASEPLQAWKDWLAFHQINDNANVLPGKLDDDRFAFYGETLNGTVQQRPRAKRALAAVDNALGDALGRLYVEAYFPASAKAEIAGMADNIKAAFAARLEQAAWLAPATRAEALAKVRGIVVGVGYPDHWLDYSGLTVLSSSSPGAAYLNQQAANQVKTAQQLAKVGKPLDRGEWWMNAQLVNAVNLPVQNALNFPAAILQQPFFDPKADAAYNYGAIGATIGHEISHSFDNGGAAFDAQGRLRNWWTASDFARFQQQSKALATQFDGYEPLPGLHVNGTLTLGEDIADVVGLQAAFDAYHASLHGQPAPVIDGMTGDQRFFVAFAQSWSTKERESALRAQMAIDGHAPGAIRPETVRNIDGWYAAFNVKPGDKLYLPPEQRVHIW